VSAIRIDCQVWWCARPAGHHGEEQQMRGRAIGEVHPADDATVGVSLAQDGDQAPAVALWLVTQDGPIRVANLDPAAAARLAESIDQTGHAASDRTRNSPPAVLVWLLFVDEEPEALSLDPTSALRAARLLARAASLLTEPDGWCLGRLDSPCGQPPCPATTQPPSTGALR
jgi:hypothetical protein